QLLDDIYQCRMGAVTTMLQQSLANKSVELLLVSESSANGVMEFDPTGVAKPEQPKALVEARVLDEVKRADKFLQANRATYRAGLMFLPYEDEYDRSINLTIGGVASMPTVLDYIWRIKSAAAEA